MSDSLTLTVIIPANNEQGYIGPCLQAMVDQTFPADGAPSRELIVAANACTDNTIAEAENLRSALEAAGWQLVIQDSPTPGKLGALNRAESIARGRVFAYLDADVICDAGMMVALVDTLDNDTPLYSSGTLVVAPCKSFVTKHFAKVWQNLPFMRTNVQGAGLFAVNRAGRSRWDAFPDVIADDGYVRLMFTPEERIKVEPAYHWPMVEGFSALVKVRRRQDAGVRELAEKFPEIMGNESKPPMHPRDHLLLFAKQPISYTIYVAVMLAVKSRQSHVPNWTRGR